MKQIKISIYNKNTSPEDVIGTNGVAILDNICTKAETEEDLSTGNYVLDATFLIDEEGIYNYLKEEAILKVKMDYGDEIFTISKVENGTRYIDIVARQITISESLALHLEDVRPTETSGAGAMQHMLDNAYGRKNITVFSDITKKGTAYYIEKSLYEALHDSENSFQEVWGGEILRRQYNLSILSHVGQDNGVCIMEGRNLKGFEGISSIDELCTRGRGQGYNGIKGNYILSPLVNSYSGVYTKIFEYSNVKVRDENTSDDEEGIIFNSEKEAINYLDKLVEKEFSENDVDKIKAIYSIDYEQLEKTVEYKDYVKSERALIGDTIRVYIPRLDVDINVRVMVKKYDVLAQKVISLTLSNYIQPKAIKFSDIQNQLNKLSQENKNMLEQAKDFATASIIAGMKNSYVIVKKNMIIVGDTEDINTMQNCWIWTKDGLGHSSTGVNGQMNTALTSDGQIVADRILTGVLSAILIRSLDGKSYFNLSTGKLVLGNGQIIVNNQNDEKVMWVDENGHLATDTLEVFGDSSSTVSFHGKGAKAINFKSDDAKDLFINFWRGTDTKTRIGIYKAEEGESDRSYQLFIEPGSTISDKEPAVILRGANSTPEENEMCILETYGDVIAIRNLYIGSNTSKINVREEIESLKARINILESK